MNNTKKRHFIKSSSESEYNNLINKYHYVLDYIESYDASNSTNMFTTLPTFLANCALIELQKIIATEQSIAVVNYSKLKQYEFLVPINKIAHDIRNKIDDSVMSIIKEFNNISFKYDSNIVNIAFQYISIFDFYRDINESCLNIGQEFIFSSLLFLEPDTIEKSNTFTSYIPFKKHVLALDSFLSGCRDASTVKKVERLLPSIKSHIKEKKIKSRLLGLWIWDYYNNPYIDKIGTDEDIKQLAIKFYFDESSKEKDRRYQLKEIDDFYKFTNDSICKLKVVPMHKLRYIRLSLEDAKNLLPAKLKDCEYGRPIIITLGNEYSYKAIIKPIKKNTHDKQKEDVIDVDMMLPRLEKYIENVFTGANIYIKGLDNKLFTLETIDKD